MSTGNIGLLGFGRFGQLVYRHLPAGRVAGVFDQDPAKLAGLSDAATLEQVLTAKYIILATPISAIDAVCKQISPVLRTGQVIVDTCSVKQYPVDCMSSRLPSGIQILGTHPLFGPDSGKNGIGGMKIAVCPVRIDAANYSNIRNYLHGLGLEIIETTPRQHDRRLARTQAVFHLISQALKELDWREQRLSTPGPAAFYRLAETVQNDTAELFLDMERRNVYARAYRREFIGKLIEIDELLSRGEPSGPA